MLALYSAAVRLIVTLDFNLTFGSTTLVSVAGNHVRYRITRRRVGTYCVYGRRRSRTFLPAPPPGCFSKQPGGILFAQSCTARFATTTSSNRRGSPLCESLSLAGRG